MNAWSTNLMRLAPSRDLLGWGVSAVIHAAGAMLAWSTFSSTVWLDHAKLPGDRARVELAATWSVPEEQRQMDPLVSDPLVLVMPKVAQVAERTFRQTATDVSKPTQTELAWAERRPRCCRRARPDVGTSALPELDAPKPEVATVPRRASAVKVPTVEPSAASSASQAASVGNENRTPAEAIEQPPSKLSGPGDPLRDRGHRGASGLGGGRRSGRAGRVGFDHRAQDPRRGRRPRRRAMAFCPRQAPPVGPSPPRSVLPIRFALD